MGDDFDVLEPIGVVGLCVVRLNLVWSNNDIGGDGVAGLELIEPAMGSLSMLAVLAFLSTDMTLPLRE
jgi:hypothetical protein